jgi:iron-sulfur cluster assembly protein
LLNLLVQVRKDGTAVAPERPESWQQEEPDMIVLTDEAATAVRTAMSRAGKTECGLRIMVEAGGCAGYKYLIGLDSEPRSDDAVIESSGVRLFIDPDSQPVLTGMRVGFVESLEGSGFTFDNPNANSKCSCGKSFG